MGNRDSADRSPEAHADSWAMEAEVLADGSKTPPVEVEEIARQKGYPWRYWRVADGDLVDLDGARWEWSTACAWGAAFTRAKAAESVAAFKKWHGREWRNPVGRAVEGRTPQLVAAELRNALAAGKVKAWAFQGSRAVTIPAAEWPALEWRRDAHGETLKFEELMLFGEARYRRVTVSRAEVMRLWLARDGWAPDESAVDDPSGPVDDAPIVEAVVEDAQRVAEESTSVDIGTAEAREVMSDEHRHSWFCAEASRLEGHWTQPRLHDHLRDVFPDLKPTFKEAAAASKFLLQVPKRGGHGPQPSRKKPLKSVKSDIRG